MADLEHLLLEAAGRTGTAGRRGVSHSQMRRRHGSYSNDGSDSGDDESDSEAPANRNRPQIPPKKRFDPPELDGRSVGANDSENSEEEDDERRGSYDSDSELSIGSDLYKDDEDREKLAKMSELEREMILADRSTKRDDYWLKKKARASSKVDREETPPPSRSGRSSVRSEKKSAKVDALNELRAKRLKVQESDSPHKSWDASPGVGTINTRGSSPVKSKRFTVAATPSDSSSSDSEDKIHTGDHGFAGDNDSGDSDEDGSASGFDPPTFDDVKAITIQRSKLAKWLVEPFFEELMAGCFVRVGIGMSKTGQRIYRLCLVKNIDASDPNSKYKLENRTTYKYLNCIWGNDSSAARWQMARVSDTDPLVEEFEALVREVEHGGGRMPSRNDVLEKIEAIKKVNTFVYSAATVKQILQEKKFASSRPTNIAAEKNRLRKDLEVAEMRGDEVQMQKLQARLKELESMSRQAEKDAKALRLAEMNRKNRAENFKNASELKPLNTSLKAGDAGYDPFSRRWTRSCNYYAPKSGGAGEGSAGNVTNDVEPGGGSVAGASVVEAGKEATAAALEAAADAGKLVDTKAPVDQGTESNMLHSFEIPISLAKLKNFGGSLGFGEGFMARKQKIESTIGCKLPENDGRRHALTLTVSDYNRRRGLL